MSVDLAMIMVCVDKGLIKRKMAKWDAWGSGKMLGRTYGIDIIRYMGDWDMPCYDVFECMVMKVHLKGQYVVCLLVWSSLIACWCTLTNMSVFGCLLLCDGYMNSLLIPIFLFVCSCLLLLFLWGGRYKLKPKVSLLD